MLIFPYNRRRPPSLSCHDRPQQSGKNRNLANLIIIWKENKTIQVNRIKNKKQNLETAPEGPISSREPDTGNEGHDRTHGMTMKKGMTFTCKSSPEQLPSNIYVIVPL